MALPALALAQTPFGSFDTPPNGSTNLAGAINVTGWALSVNRVDHLGIYRDPLPGEATQLNGLVFIQNALFIAGARPDVKAMYPNYPDSDLAGWGTQLLSNELPSTNGRGLGNGNYVLYAIAFDHSDPVHNYTVLGRKSISVDNADSHAPFGTIDYPHEGETVSGTAYANFGWALTPQPNIIPIDGSTIWVSIDGQAAHPVYNDTNRTDIASIFPGLQNSNGAGGHYVFNPAQFGPGLHTISWNVTDNVGNMAGLGSRYFTIGGATARYTVGGTTAGGTTFSVYNDNIERIVATPTCEGNADCRTASCSVTGSNGGVTVAAVNRTFSSHDLSVRADYTAWPGVRTRTITCSVMSPDGSYTGSAALSVYDASPVVTSVERYNSPGNRTFVQGEGAVGVRILGHNFGKNTFNDTSRLRISGADITVQSIAWWHDDGTEIDAVFNIGSTALGTYTVTVNSNGASGNGFLSTGGTSSSGNGTILVVHAPPIIGGISLDSIVAGSTGYIVIYGQYLDGQPQVTIDGTGATITGISYASAIQINVSYSVDSGAPPGPRNLIVTTSSGVASTGIDVVPTVTISGDVGVAKGDTTDYNVQLSSNSSAEPIQLTIMTTSGSGSAHFSDGTTSMAITDSQIVTVVGDTESSDADNITFLAQPQRRPNRQLAQQKLSVVTVSITLRTGLNLSPSGDNAGRSAYLLNLGTSALGPIVVFPDNMVEGFCGVGAEFVGQVTPTTYAGTVTLKRDIIGGVSYRDSTVYRVSEPHPDPSDPTILDADPQSGGSNGKVYDLDAPGIGSDGTTSVFHVRKNFQAYAVLGPLSSTKRASNIFPWWVRASCMASGGHLMFNSDISGDNQIGIGTTNTNWNLQP